SHRLQHRRLLECHPVRQLVYDARGNDNVLSKRSMAAIIRAGNAQDLSVIAQVDFTATAEIAGTTEDCGIEGDSITLCNLVHACFNGCNNARCFVSHHDGRNTPSRRAVISMHVTAANSASSNSYQDFVRCRNWGGQVSDFQGTVFGK